MRYFLLFFTLLLVGHCFAEQSPRDLPSDSKIKMVNYKKDDVVSLNADVFVNTQIIFGDDEQVLDIQNGDSSAWTIHINKVLPYIVNIKPTISGSNTDLSVVTVDAQKEKRFYHFHIVSTAQSDDQVSSVVYALKFAYPDKQQRLLEQKLSIIQQQNKSLINSAKRPEAYNWDYSFHGDKRVVPIHVFDDGKFTYLQLRDSQSIPAIFAVDNASGKESVVNTRREGQYVIIQQVAPQFTLRNGKYIVASIFNNKLIAKIKHNGVMQ